MTTEETIVVLQEKLKATKTQVERAWPYFQEEALLEGIVNNSDTSITRAKEIIEQKVKPKKKRSYKTVQNELEKNLDAVGADKIGLAFWYIKKIGDIDQAERLIRIAAKAIREAIG